MTDDLNPSDQFLTLFPGVYTAQEQQLVDEYLAGNQALLDRGPIVGATLAAGTLPTGTPGVGPSLPVTEAMVRYNNTKYDPENPLLHDADYARERGYSNILAFPTFGAHDDTFMVAYPFEARDTLLVSQLDHSVTTYEPIHPGDTLVLVANRRTVVDRTPASGSTYRTLRIETEGSVYNQHGRKVNDVVFGVTESIRIYRADSKPETRDFRAFWEAPDWTSRPAHYYTDDDWTFIIDVWRNEYRRGKDPLYWDDVKVGDRPAWTADGPIDRSVLPTDPYGMGTDGSRSLKPEILDPTARATMVRGADGIYRLPDLTAHILPVPDGAESPMAQMVREGEIVTADIHRQTDNRAVLINFLGRDIAIRHINNWMGENGRLRTIRWGIMSADSMAANGKPVPEEPTAGRFLDVVPDMHGRRTTIHGLTGDLALVKSYVYDTYVRDSEFLVDLAWWIENIDGDIWISGSATVALPSRRTG